MTLKLKEGGYYKTADGTLVGPLQRYPENRAVFEIDHTSSAVCENNEEWAAMALWESDGSSRDGRNSEALVSECYSDGSPVLVSRPDTHRTEFIDSLAAVRGFAVEATISQHPSLIASLSAPASREAFTGTMRVLIAQNSQRLQQQWLIESQTERRYEWRDVPVVTEE